MGITPNLMPFGKHKGQFFGDLVTTDPGYASWLANQEWFQTKFRFHYKSLAGWLSQTPAGRIVDNVDALCSIAKVALGAEALAMSAAAAKEMNKRFSDAEQDPAVTHKCGITFHNLSGWDAVYQLNTFADKGRYSDTIALKIMPTLGDDWRSVLKRVAAMQREGDTCVLAIFEYNGSRAPLKQVAHAFEESNIRLIKLCKVEGIDEHILYAPADVDPWHEALIRWLADCKAGDLFTIEAFLDCMVGRQCDTDHRRVAEMLTKLGCIQTGEYLPGTDGRVEFWQRPT